MTDLILTLLIGSGLLALYLILFTNKSEIKAFFLSFRDKYDYEDIKKMEREYSVLSHSIKNTTMIGTLNIIEYAMIENYKLYFADKVPDAKLRANIESLKAQIKIKRYQLKLQNI